MKPLERTAPRHAPMDQFAVQDGERVDEAAYLARQNAK